VLGQGQRERARSVQVLAGAVPEDERPGRPGGVPAEAPVQRVRQPHQVVEARRGERGRSRHDFRSGGRRFRSRPRRAPAPAATAAAAATGTGETAQPQSDQTVQPEGQTADQGHDHRWRWRWG